MRRPTLFETRFASDKMRLFGLSETLREDGWLKAVRLDDYAPRWPLSSSAGRLFRASVATLRFNYRRVTIGRFASRNS